MAGRPRLEHDVQLTVRFLRPETPEAIAHLESCRERLVKMLPWDEILPRAPEDERSRVLAAYGLDFTDMELVDGGTLAIGSE